jgi:hypothetical protein
MHSISRHLPPELQYACRYWTQHLLQRVDPVMELVKAFSFLEAHFLHWVEAMGALSTVSELVGMIRKLRSIRQVSTCEAFRHVKILKRM